MKYLLAAAVALLFAVSCFDDDTTKPDPGDGKEENPYTGAYALTSTFVSSDCVMPAPDPGATMTILVDGEKLVVNTEVVGAWDSALTAGTATSTVRCVPMPPSYACTTCSWYEIDIDFFSPDSFNGTFRAYYDYRGDCGSSSDCETVWETIGGR